MAKRTKENEPGRGKMKAVQNRVTGPDLLEEFVRESEENLEKAAQGLLRIGKKPNDGEAFDRVSRAVHTLRGNASVFGLKQIIAKTRSTEDMLKQIRDKRPFFSAHEINKILRNTQQLRLMLEKIRHSKSSSVKKKSTDANQSSLQNLLRRTPRIVRDLAHTQGKRVLVRVHTEDCPMSPKRIKLLKEALLHLLRNAVAHGIEKPRERKVKGNRAKGLISVCLTKQGSDIRLAVQDNGKGIQKSAVISQAVSRGLLSFQKARRLSTQKIYGLLFEPGFSTSRRISSIGGFGFGLDVVKKNVKSLGGTLTVKSTPGKGSCFTIQLPR